MIIKKNGEEIFWKNFYSDFGYREFKRKYNIEGIKFYIRKMNIWGSLLYVRFSYENNLYEAAFGYLPCGKKRYGNKPRLRKFIKEGLYPGK